jgi:hypothetical protein
MPPKKRIALDERWQQEIKAAQITRGKQQDLNVLEHPPPLWMKREFKQIRESISFIYVHPDLFPIIGGNILPDVFDDRHGDAKAPTSLTKEYVSRIAGKQCVARQRQCPHFPSCINQEEV